MRKLMLIAVIALMTASPCYANLSLASADTSPATEQPKTTAATPTKTPVAEARHARPERSARTSRHPQYHHWAESRFSYARYFRGGC
jgi:hypothetical protein